MGSIFKGTLTVGRRTGDMFSPSMTGTAVDLSVELMSREECVGATARDTTIDQSGHPGAIPLVAVGPQAGEGSIDERQQQFWREFLADLKIDDPEQPVPSPARLGYLSFMLPAPSGSSWLTVYRDQRANEVGVFLSSSRNSAGEYAMQVVADEWSQIKDELNGTAQPVQADGRPRIIDSLKAGSLDDPEVRRRAFEWLAERVNTFINVLQPRVRSAVADFLARDERPT